jgi:hypothetical protein
MGGWGRLRMRKPRHGTVVAYVALAVATCGTAGAATGGNFILGKSNSAGTVTTLSNGNGTALALKSKSGTPSLAVNSQSKVANLNVDRLDGLDSTALQRRITSCAAGTAVRGVSSSGKSTCTTFETKTVQGTMSNLGGYADCPNGWLLLGGGYDQGLLPEADQYVSISRPSGQSWYVYIVDPSSPYAATGTPYAVCGRLN